VSSAVDTTTYRSEILRELNDTYVGKICYLTRISGTGDTLTVRQVSLVLAVEECTHTSFDLKCFDKYAVRYRVKFLSSNGDIASRIWKHSTIEKLLVPLHESNFDKVGE
jgi:hypothetical protein